MCKEVEELIAEFGEEFKKEGAMNAKIETAQSLSEMGMPLDKIAYALKTDASVVAQWINKGVSSVQ